MDLNHQYTKLRSAFGRQPMFCERGPEVLDSITTDTQLFKQFVLKNPVHQPIQNTPNFSQCYVNTIRPDYVNAGISHLEGGWNKDINPNDPEQTVRYRRKVEKDDGYQHCINSLTPGFIHYIRQNNAVNLYESYYRSMPQQPQLEKHVCRVVNIYKDKAGRRPINSISFQTDGGNKFAAAYADLNFFQKPKGSVTCFIWNVEIAIEPECSLIPPYPMCDLQFNPKDVNLLCGGLVNGQVCAFDLRQGPAPVVMCPIHVAHAEIVKNVLYVNSKSGQEFFSGSTDGTIRWWDIRNMNEPIDDFVVDVVKTANDNANMQNAMGVSVMEYETTIPSRFMLGTVNGYVVTGNRKGKSQNEKFPMKNKSHDGPIFALERNPFFLKNFLTAGDWTVRIWSEDCRESSIIFTRPFRHKITHAAWSPSKTSVFVMCQRNGKFSCWDLLKKQNEATVVMQVCPEPLLISKPHEMGKHVACGSEAGSTYMIELSYSLVILDKNDRNLFANSLERENRRERILEARNREVRLKLRQAEEASPQQSETDLTSSGGEKDYSEVASEYFAAVKRELALL